MGCTLSPASSISEQDVLLASAAQLRSCDKMTKPNSMSLQLFDADKGLASNQGKHQTDYLMLMRGLLLVYYLGKREVALDLWLQMARNCDPIKLACMHTGTKPESRQL